jgi:hypothetical protein
MGGGWVSRACVGIKKEGNEQKEEGDRRNEKEKGR